MSMRVRCGIAVLLVVIGVGACVTSVHEGTAEPAVPEVAPHDEIAGPAAVKANADELPGTVVTPHLECEIAGDTNVLWCATFQVAWNELGDLFGGPVQVGGDPEMVRWLNRRAVTKADLDEASYVALAGQATSTAADIRQRIPDALARRFRGAASPEFLEVLDDVPSGWYVAYAYLLKELPFEWAFERMHFPMRFGGRKVEQFGIHEFQWEQENEAKAAQQVLVHDYQNRYDFVIELKTRSASDRLILAKVPPKATLAQAVAAVRSRLREDGMGTMPKTSDLLIPVIDLDVLRRYHEPTATPSLIREARQHIRFKLDEAF